MLVERYSILHGSRPQIALRQFCDSLDPSNVNELTRISLTLPVVVDNLEL